MSAAKFSRDHRSWQQRLADAQWQAERSVELQENIRNVKKQLAKFRLRKASAKEK